MDLCETLATVELFFVTERRPVMFAAVYHSRDTSLRLLSTYLLLHLLLTSTGASAASGAFLALSSTGPAVLDSPIRFDVTLRNADHLKGPFVFRWSDNASPAHWKEQEVSDRTCNLTLVYSSREYEAGDYTMTVMTFAFVGIFREEIATTSVPFEITKELNGKIFINDISSPTINKVVVSTLNTTELTVYLHDPLQYLSQAQLSYYWFINDTNFGLTTKPEFSYEFIRAGASSVEVTVLAYFPNSSSTLSGNRIADSSFNHAFVKNRNSAAVVTPPGVKFGILRAKLESRLPLSRLNFTGNTWLKHGELLNLGASCDGTGPWKYCWSIKTNDYNVTGNETCQDPETLTGSCDFPIVWYFRRAGTSDILVIVSDALNTRRQLIHVNIYEVHSQTPLTVIVIPIISLIAAVAVLFLGFYTIHQFKINLSVETADFDFNPREDALEPKTFWERLRDSMVNTFQSSSSGDTLSHVSSASSRSGAGAQISGIHYGSIP